MEINDELRILKSKVEQRARVEPWILNYTSFHFTLLHQIIVLNYVPINFWLYFFNICSKINFIICKCCFIYATNCKSFKWQFINSINCFYYIPSMRRLKQSFKLNLNKNDPPFGKSKKSFTEKIFRLESCPQCMFDKSKMTWRNSNEVNLEKKSKVKK